MPGALCIVDGMRRKKTRAPLDYALQKRVAIDIFKRWIVQAAMTSARGNVTRAARLTNLDPANFRRLLREVGAAPSTLPKPCQP